MITNNSPYRLLIAGCLFLLIANPVFSAVCDIKPGMVVCAKGSIDTLTANGKMTAKDTKISQSLIVNGELDAKHITVKNLEVNGFAILKQSTILNNFIMRGNLDLSSSSLNETLNLYSNQAHFSDSKINNIHVFKTNDPKQIIRLNKHCQVKGNIVFDSGKGIVIAEKGTNLSGKVSGATVIYQ